MGDVNKILFYNVLVNGEFILFFQLDPSIDLDEGKLYLTLQFFTFNMFLH